MTIGWDIVSSRIPLMHGKGIMHERMTMQLAQGMIKSMKMKTMKTTMTKKRMRKKTMMTKKRMRKMMMMMMRKMNHFRKKAVIRRG